MHRASFGAYMHAWVTGPLSLRGARTPLGFPSPDAPPSTLAVLGSSEERCFFMPEPGSLVLLCTMQIPALLSTDVGSASRVCTTVSSQARGRLWLTPRAR